MIGWEVFRSGFEHPDPVLVGFSLMVVVGFLALLVWGWRR